VVPKQFHSKSVTYHGTIRLAGPIEMVFPLFTPEGEKGWAEGWNPQYVYPPDGTTQQGLVFRTSHSGPLIWIVSKFDSQQHEISYVILGKDTVRQLVIKCVDEGTRTSADLAHTYTSLSEEGNEIVEHHTPEGIGDEIKGWESEINYFLKTGKQLTTPRTK
jgi:hypothetical protein